MCPFRGTPFGSLWCLWPLAGNIHSDHLDKVLSGFSPVQLFHVVFNNSYRDTWRQQKCPSPY